MDFVILLGKEGTHDRETRLGVSPELGTIPAAKVPYAGGNFLSFRELRGKVRRQKRRLGGLLSYVKIQSHLRFVRSDILKWMEEHQFKPGNRSRK
jgi:hypothetical protein